MSGVAFFSSEVLDCSCLLRSVSYGAYLWFGASPHTEQLNAPKLKKTQDFS